ncbi:ATP-NAD kinase-like domain-containing protein [Xylaria intraflava]|nr:ATP-NAD kinase-like domain-containing protein [Xylaria intraflava]
MSPNNDPAEIPASAKFPNPEDIICILKKQSSIGEVYRILSLTQREQDGEPSFTLSRTFWTGNDGDENKPSQPLLKDYLIDDLPVHLQPGPQRRVHVLVSTRSGTGLSLHFYNNILAPLLEELGLAASNEPEQSAVSRNGSYHLLITQDAESVRTFARDLGERSRPSRDEDGGGTVVSEKDPEHTIVLLSGDGGVVEMLNSYVPTTDNHMAASNPAAVSLSPPLISILPLGTGNALFSSLHRTVKIPAASSDLVRGLRTLLQGKPAPLPSFKLDFPENSRVVTYSEALPPPSTGNHPTDPTNSILALEERTQYVTRLYGVVVASYGFHSQLVWESDTPEYRRHGAKRFHMVAEELLRESHAYQATVELGIPSNEGITTRRLGQDQHSYILTTLVSNLEKTFCISPASQPLDGQLRLVHFGPVDGAKTVEIMTAAYDGGRHVGMRWGAEDEDGVGYEEIAEVRIRTHEEDARWRKVCIDGTIVEIPTGGCMVVSRDIRRHLSVLVDRPILSEPIL